MAGSVSPWRPRSIGPVWLADRLETSLGEMSSAQAFDLLNGWRVPCEICAPDFARGLFADPQMRAHGLVVEHQHPRLGTLETYGRTITFSETQAPNWGPPPLCGQHTREILSEYGLDDADIDKLIEARAIFEELWVD